MCQQEQIDVLDKLIELEMLLLKEATLLTKKAVKPTDALERYIKMAMRIDPKNPKVLIRNANDFNTLGTFLFANRIVWEQK